MKQLFDKVSLSTSKMLTRAYSTSFSIGIHCLHRKFHEPVYAIYGFVRVADEIVDSFHDYDKEHLLADFRNQTYEAIEKGISTNPVLNSFQSVVRQYGIEKELIECFLHSMKMDLSDREYTAETYDQYILGSAEVVGLMCLRVFTEGSEELYQHLRPAAMKLGSAFQKVNFLRDMQADYITLGRVYFPSVNMHHFSEVEKHAIEADIQKDFDEAMAGIRQLPVSSRLGVYVSYVYYKTLFAKIKAVPSARIMQERIRISNYRKAGLLAESYLKHSFGAL